MIYSTTVPTETSYEDYPLEEGKTYYYTLVVYNTYGSNANSNVVQVDIPNYYPTPSKLDVVSVGGTVELSWTQNHDSDFNRYELYRSNSDNTLGKLMHSTSVVIETGYKDSNVEGSTTYYYTVVVYDNGGLSAKSNVKQVTTPVF